MPYALSPMPYAHEYLIFRSKGYTYLFYCSAIAN